MKEGGKRSVVWWLITVGFKDRVTTERTLHPVSEWVTYKDVFIHPARFCPVFLLLRRRRRQLFNKLTARYEFSFPPLSSLAAAALSQFQLSFLEISHRLKFISVSGYETEYLKHVSFSSPPFSRKREDRMQIWGRGRRLLCCWENKIDQKQQRTTIIQWWWGIIMGRAPLRTDREREMDGWTKWRPITSGLFPRPRSILPPMPDIHYILHT